jgi:hypothetical protein
VVSGNGVGACAVFASSFGEEKCELAVRACTMTGYHGIYANDKGVVTVEGGVMRDCDCWGMSASDGARVVVRSSSSSSSSSVRVGCVRRRSLLSRPHSRAACVLCVGAATQARGVTIEGCKSYGVYASDRGSVVELEGCTLRTNATDCHQRTGGGKIVRR